MLPEVKRLIEHYQLQPLPVEKTLFSSTYRAKQRFDNSSPYGSAIIGLYCDEPYSVSLFHQLPVDEIWHFYAGDPLKLILLYPDGSSQDIMMGNNPLDGHHVQFVVPAGVWQAGHLIEGGRYALYGCTMAPGFRDDMFLGGTYQQLTQLCPARAAEIKQLCCPEDQTRMTR